MVFPLCGTLARTVPNRATPGTQPVRSRRPGLAAQPTCPPPRPGIAVGLTLRRGRRFHGKAGLDPVLDALAVLAHVGVAERLEFAGHLPAVRARGVRAVGD